MQHLKQPCWWLIDRSGQAALWKATVAQEVQACSERQYRNRDCQGLKLVQDG